MVTARFLRVCALAALAAQLQPLAGGFACAVMRRAPAEACEGMAPEQSGPAVTQAADAATHTECARLGPCAATNFAVAAGSVAPPQPSDVPSLPAPAPVPVSFLTPPLPPPPLV